MIEQAKGYLAARDGISLDEAFDWSRSHARQNHRSIREVAHAILDGDLFDPHQA